ncbi:MAG: hypothetical protein KDA80_02150 [Planctomycetaceae bacterium]|nr:hypothetical protein [Planctomycetaceae bacterium]
MDDLQRTDPASASRRQKRRWKLKWRRAQVYLLWCFLLGFFVAPLIAPTDVAPPGPPPIPASLLAIQFLVISVLPIPFVIRDERRSRRDSNLGQGERPVAGQADERRNPGRQDAED